MTVRAKQLEVRTDAGGDVRHQRYAIALLSLLVASAVCVIELKDAYVVMTTTNALAAQFGQSDLSHFGEALFAPIALILASVLSVLVAPFGLVYTPFWVGVNASFSSLGVVARPAPQPRCSFLASREVIFRFCLAAASACKHVLHLSRGKRIPMTMDQIMPGYH